MIVTIGGLRQLILSVKGMISICDFTLNPVYWESAVMLMRPVQLLWRFYPFYLCIYRHNRQISLELVSNPKQVSGSGAAGNFVRYVQPGLPAADDAVVLRVFERRLSGEPAGLPLVNCIAISR